MRPSFIALIALGAVALASSSTSADDTVLRPSAVSPQPLMSAEHAAKIREEMRLHEMRAREIEPIIARDRQARHDVEVDWAVLERHGRDLHARANEFRTYAGELPGRGQGEMNGFANELDTFATHDEDNARGQHEIAERLDRSIQTGIQTREWHQRMAARLRDWLSANGY